MSKPLKPRPRKVTAQDIADIRGALDFAQDIARTRDDREMWSDQPAHGLPRTTESGVEPPPAPSFGVERPLSSARGVFAVRAAGI